MADKNINQLDEIVANDVNENDWLALYDVSTNLTFKTKVQSIGAKAGLGINLRNLADVSDTATPTDGYLIIGNGSAFVPITLNDLLIALLPDLTGYAGYVLTVNTGETGVEWTAGGIGAGGASTSVTNTWTAGQRGQVTTVTYAGTTTLNLDDSNFFTITLTGNILLANPTNQVAGQSGSIWLVQDATGSRTLSLGSNFKTSLGSAIELTTTANAVDRLDYVVRSSGNVEVSIAKDLK